MSTPTWGLPWPAPGDPGDMPTEFGVLATAMDAGFERWLGRWQTGTLQVSLGEDVDRLETQVTFATPYTSNPVVMAIHEPAATGSRGNLYYAQVSRITTTGFWLHTIFRNDPPKQADTVDVSWFAYGED